MSLPATKCLVFALCWTLQFALEAEETLRGQFALEAEETLRAAVTAADEKVAEAEEAVEAAEAAAAEKAAEAEVALVEAHRAAVAGLEEQHSRAIAQNEAAAATLTAEWEAKLLVKERENQAAAAGHSTELATQVRLFGLLCFQCVCLSQEPDRVALTPNTLTPPGGLDQAKEHQSDFAAQAREHQKELAAQAKDHQKLVHAHSASEMALAKKQVLSAAFRLPFHCLSVTFHCHCRRAGSRRRPSMTGRRRRCRSRSTFALTAALAWGTVLRRAASVSSHPPMCLMAALQKEHASTIAKLRAEHAAALTTAAAEWKAKAAAEEAEQKSQRLERRAEWEERRSEWEERIELSESAREEAAAALAAARGDTAELNTLVAGLREEAAAAAGEDEQWSGGVAGLRSEVHEAAEAGRAELQVRAKEPSLGSFHRLSLPFRGVFAAFH